MQSVDVVNWALTGAKSEYRVQVCGTSRYPRYIASRPGKIGGVTLNHENLDLLVGQLESLIGEKLCPTKLV